MSKAYDTNRLSVEEQLMYESITRQIKDNYNYTDNLNNCPGYVNVHSYMRDGKEVRGYIRNCPYHEN